MLWGEVKNHRADKQLVPVLNRKCMVESIDNVKSGMVLIVQCILGSNPLIQVERHSVKNFALIATRITNDPNEK